MTGTLAGVNYSVGAKGQVVIPKEIRDALQIQPGQDITFEMRGEEVVLRKAAANALKGRFAHRDLTAALLDARRIDRDLDDRRS